MKVPYDPSQPVKGLKPLSTLVVFQSFQDTLLWEAVDALCRAMPQAEVQSFPPETRLGELLAESGAGSLFAEERLLRQVRVADGGKYTTKDSLAALERFLAAPGDTRLCIAVEAPRGNPAWLKNLSAAFSKGKGGQLLALPRFYEKEALALAGRLCQDHGLKPTPGALKRMVTLTDGLADRLVNEIRKLSLYLGDDDPKVTDALVDRVFDPATEENTFSLVDDLLAGDRSRLALRMQQFRQQSTSFAPPLLLGSMMHLLDTLLDVAAAMEGPLSGARGYNAVKAAVDQHRQALPGRLRGLHPFILTKHVDLVQRIGPRRLRRAALDLHHVDRRLKGATHSAADPYTLLGEWLMGLLPA